MKKWEFPNQICAVKNCKNKRKYLVIFQGLTLNLCAKHIGTLEDNEPLNIKEPSLDNIMRKIEE